MTPDADRRICDFLASTLALWEVDGCVEPFAPHGVASIRVGESRIVLERAPAGDPFRWYLRQVSVDASTNRNARTPTRPCGSLVGVLGGLRRMLGVEKGAVIRIARESG